MPAPLWRLPLLSTAPHRTPPAAASWLAETPLAPGSLTPRRLATGWKPPARRQRLDHRLARARAGGARGDEVALGGSMGARSLRPEAPASTARARVGRIIGGRRLERRRPGRGQADGVGVQVEHGPMALQIIAVGSSDRAGGCVLADSGCIQGQHGLVALRGICRRTLIGLADPPSATEPRTACFDRCPHTDYTIP